MIHEEKAAGLKNLLSDAMIQLVQGQLSNNRRTDLTIRTSQELNMTKKKLNQNSH